jgi:hypothetical protein
MRKNSMAAPAANQQQSSPVLVAVFADPQQPDRVPQRAASSSGPAPIVSLFCCYLQRNISYRSHRPSHASLIHHRGAGISWDRGNCSVAAASGTCRTISDRIWVIPTWSPHIYRVCVVRMS